MEYVFEKALNNKALGIKETDRPLFFGSAQLVLRELSAEIASKGFNRVMREIIEPFGSRDGAGHSTMDYLKYL